jgi:hypothetical protein
MQGSSRRVANSPSRRQFYFVSIRLLEHIYRIINFSTLRQFYFVSIRPLELFLKNYTYNHIHGDRLRLIAISGVLFADIRGRARKMSHRPPSEIKSGLNRYTALCPYKHRNFLVKSSHLSPVLHFELCKEQHHSPKTRSGNGYGVAEDPPVFQAGWSDCANFLPSIFRFICSSGIPR